MQQTSLDLLRHCVSLSGPCYLFQCHGFRDSPLRDEMDVLFSYISIAGDWPLSGSRERTSAGLLLPEMWMNLKRDGWRRRAQRSIRGGGRPLGL